MFQIKPGVSKQRTMSDDESRYNDVVQGNAFFTRRLYRALSTKSNDNIFFSPLSLHAVMSLVAQGAYGETKKALHKTLSIPTLEITARGYKEIMEELTNIEDVTLHLTNKLYINETYKLKKDFKNVITKLFHCEVDQVDFSKSCEAAQSINSWVEYKTNNKIKDLINETDLNDRTRLVLVNAIYFKGHWAKPFDADETTIEKFYINDNEAIETRMMHTTDTFYFSENGFLNSKILAMPYQNRNVNLVIILPNQRSRLEELELKLESIDLSRVMGSMRNTEVNVSIPRFRIEFIMDLSETLSEVQISFLL